MGTSISQSSSRNTNWKPVHIGYQNNSIPENRIINEIWRASENESTPISETLKSDAIYTCFSIVSQTPNFQEAMKMYNNYIFENKNNSIIAEFAKRVIPTSFQLEEPAKNWTNKFFAEITNYVMSRDLSGFVGENNRNKSVQDLIAFKKQVSDKVSNLINSQNINIKSKNDWDTFVDNTISNLKTAK